MSVESQDTCVWTHRIHVCGVTGYMSVESVDLCGGTDCVCIHQMYAGSLDMSGVTGCVCFVRRLAGQQMDPGSNPCGPTFRC